jgi:hypothetical protein
MAAAFCHWVGWVRGQTLAAGIPDADQRALALTILLCDRSHLRMSRTAKMGSLVSVADPEK